MEDAIEEANKPYARNIWDGHQVGNISLDKTHELVEFEYIITEDDANWIESEIMENGRPVYTKWIIANFVCAYEFSLSEDDSNIGGEHNPPSYRAIKKVLDEARQAGLSIGFSIKYDSGESATKINCDCADFDKAITNWKELN